MKLYIIQVALVITAALGHLALLVSGISCGSACAACWKNDDNNGVDTKFFCKLGRCGDACPDGYHGIHCARFSRCV